MTKYELIYIIDTALEDEAKKALIARVNARIEEGGGTLEKVDEWGKRRLAYPINYKTEGYYVLTNFSATGDLPREIERILQINDQVLRYLCVKLEQKSAGVKPRAVMARPVYGRPAQPEFVREEAPAPAPVNIDAAAVAETLAAEISPED